MHVKEHGSRKVVDVGIDEIVSNLDNRMSFAFVILIQVLMMMYYPL